MPRTTDKKAATAAAVQRLAAARRARGGGAAAGGGSSSTALAAASAAPLPGHGEEEEDEGKSGKGDLAALARASRILVSSDDEEDGGNDGVESDDLVAAQARTLARAGHEVLIVSADKDFAQCVDDHIKLLVPPPTANPKLGWRVLDRAGVVEKFGVPPESIAEYLALIGDTSDNIPGISGVGPKTALKWFTEFKSLEGIIAGATQLKPERFGPVVAQEADKLRRNLKLTTLRTELPLPPLTAGEPAASQLFSLLESLEMRASLAEAKQRYTGQQELF
jgi:hypothetical protein